MPTRSHRFVVLAAALALAAAPARASQWLKLTAPVAGSTVLGQTVKFQYAIDVHGFRQHTKDFKNAIGVFITVCTGGCSVTADFIDYRELGPTEQTTTSFAVSKIKQHLTKNNLPIGTPIKWNLRFHLPGTFYDPTEVQTDSSFFLGQLEAAGGAHLEARPNLAPATKPH